MMDVDLKLHTIVDTFTDLLSVAIHRIPREREIYPPTIFILAKKYDLPVHQIRYPGLCAFVNSETVEIRQAILSEMVKRIFVAIFVQGLPREHFVFGITRLLQLGLGTMGEDADFEGPFPLVDAEEQMRAVLSKLKDHCASLEPLNDQSTFRMIMEVSKGPVNEQQDKDIPNALTDDKCCVGEHATDMVKIRTVKAGRLVFDSWYGPAHTPPRVSKYAPSQPLASNESPSSSSDMYGTFPSTQVGFDD